MHRILVLATRPPVKNDSGKSSFYSDIVFSYDIIRYEKDNFVALHLSYHSSCNAAGPVGKKELDTNELEVLKFALSRTLKILELPSKYFVDILKALELSK